MKRVISLLVGLFLLLTGCGEHPQVPPITQQKALSSEQVVDVMNSIGVFGANILNRSYVLPTEGWVKSDFGRLVYADLQAANITYSPETADCDTFALDGVMVARKTYYQSANRVPKTAIAVGFFAYNKAGAGPHAIDFALVPTGEARNVKSDLLRAPVSANRLPHAG